VNVLRLTRHETDHELVILHTPPQLADAVGRFEPARYDPARRAYLLHQARVPDLYRWARHAEAHITDERAAFSASKPYTPGPECAHCAQPGSAAKPPKYCPACGETWTPIVYRDTAPSVVRGECTRCRTRQVGRFPRCAHCGGDMAYPKPQRHVELPRTRLPDPLPLADVIAETFPPPEETR
jgi:hypothetical protein